MNEVAAGARWTISTGCGTPARPAESLRGGVEKVFQQATGPESKVQQYALGRAGFVREVVAVAGMEGFNRAWQDEANLPTLEEHRGPGPCGEGRERLMRRPPAVARVLERVTRTAREHEMFAPR